MRSLRSYRDLSRVECHENPASPAHENLQLARAALQEGDEGDEGDEASECLRLLAFGFGSDATLKPLYQTAREALTRLESPDEAALFERALGDFQSARPFYDLGYHFVGAGNDRLAIPFLERAHALAPGDVEIANELCLALCGQFRPERGADILGAVLEPGESRPFWPWFQLQWARLLANRTRGIAEWIEESRATLEAANLDEEARSNTDYVLAKLESALRRLRSVPEARPLIQDWHFIQYGAAVLDYMDDSVTEGGLEVAGGRHVATWGQVDDVRRVLEKLKQFLAATGQSPELVVALEDRDSQIIGRAASQVLALPFETVNEENVRRENALVVAGDNRSIDWDALRAVAPSQTLFAFRHHWLQGSAITPDISGLLAQSYYLPWSGNAMRVEPQTRQVTSSEPDEREASVIADEIAHAKFELGRSKHKCLCGVSCGVSCGSCSTREASSNSPSFFMSCRLAPETTTASGTPAPSVRRWRLVPHFPRSVGLRPVACASPSTPFFGRAP